MAQRPVQAEGLLDRAGPDQLVAHAEGGRETLRVREGRRGGAVEVLEGRGDDVEAELLRELVQADQQGGAVHAARQADEDDVALLNQSIVAEGEAHAVLHHGGHLGAAHGDVLGDEGAVRAEGHAALDVGRLPRLGRKNVREDAADVVALDEPDVVLRRGVDHGVLGDRLVPARGDDGRDRDMMPRQNGLEGFPLIKGQLPSVAQAILKNDSHSFSPPLPRRGGSLLAPPS